MRRAFPQGGDCPTTAETVETTTVPSEADDSRFMRAALAQARLGIGKTSPNPAVGAVIVRAGRIIGRGTHRAAGLAHAEIEAICSLTSPHLTRGATLYITLEPCSTQGKTPPCTDAIIRGGFSRVVFGATDPDPRHAGRAAEILSAAGIAVRSGVLAEDCAGLNRYWNYWIIGRMPFVIAKWAMTLNGTIDSPPGRRWITGEASREDAMRLRAGVDAILIGGGTARTDNPRLTLRGIDGKQPFRVVWTRSGRLPRTLHLFSDEWRERTLVLSGCSLREALKDLGRRGVESVLIEGGGRTLGEAFDLQLVNRAHYYLAPIFGGGLVPAVGGMGASDNAGRWTLANVEARRFGGDLRVSGDVSYPRHRQLARLTRG